MNDYYIENKYKYQKCDYLKDVFDYTMKKLKLENCSFSVILTDDDEVHDLNLRYRKIDRTTDVLSFAYNDGFKIEMPVNILGDIYISIPQMRKQANEYAHSEKRELSFLALHGLLHLLGYDHIDEKDEVEMFTLQKEILDELKIQN